MKILILDAGNSIIKIKANEGREDEFPHALKELTEAEYQQIVTRTNGNPPIDYVRVNGKPYVYGLRAERYDTLTRRYGAERYRKDYYGVIVAIALARSFEASGPAFLFGSHAPGDVEYRDDLMEAGFGSWNVEIQGKELCFDVTGANTFDEPQGGLMNLVLTESGTEYKNARLNSGHSLVIDIGGRTTDFLAVLPGGEVDYSLHISFPIGLINLTTDFERSFRASNRQAMKAVDSLPPDRVREAIQSGVFRGGGKAYPCENEVREASSVLINRISSEFHGAAKGPTPWDSIILTGGGSAALYDRLTPILEHGNILMADDDPLTIHRANVRGGAKLYKLLRSMNAI